MKAGDTVEIYQRPFSREDFEGEARLVEMLSKDERDQTERWLVAFPGEDDDPVERVIYLGETAVSE